MPWMCVEGSEKEIIQQPTELEIPSPEKYGGVLFSRPLIAALRQTHIDSVWERYFELITRM